MLSFIGYYLAVMHSLQQDRERVSGAVFCHYWPDLQSFDLQPFQQTAQKFSSTMHPSLLESADQQPIRNNGECSVIQAKTYNDMGGKR